MLLSYKKTVINNVLSTIKDLQKIILMKLKKIILETVILI